MKFPTLETVLVFKNGNSVIRKIIKLPKTERKVRTEMPSSCVHGTCWITTSDAATRIISLKSVTSDRTRETTSKVKTIKDLLMGNIGNEVSLELDGGTSIEGKVLSVVNDNVILLTSDSLELFLPLSKICYVKGKELSKVYKEQEKILEIEVEYETDQDNCIGMLYSIIKRCSWAASYLLTLDTEKKTAIMRMQSTIINDAENFFAKEFICAAGSPKFAFANVQDPFVTQGMSHDSFLASLGSASGSSRSLSFNAMTSNMYQAQQFQPQQRRDYRSGSGYNASPQINEKDESGGAATDYYYYTFRNVSIEKGQRVLLPVFSQEMKYEDMYKCKLQYIPNSVDPLKVTHIVKVQNNSNQIWTTGPVCIRSNKQLFAGQSTVYFTTPKIDALIDIADALSIRVKYIENSKVNPKRNKKIYNANYVESNQVCVAEVSNFQDKDITILIEIDFVGMLREDSVSHKPTKNNTRLHNNYESSVMHHVEWEVEVKAGETKEVRFVYWKWIQDRNY